MSSIYIIMQLLRNVCSRSKYSMLGGEKKREKQGFVLNFPDKDNEI